MQPPIAAQTQVEVAPRIMFVPASGPGGAGEYMRCRILADACARRWPGAQIHFVLSRHASYARELSYPTQLLDSSPAHASAAVTAYLNRIRPDIVLFDNTGRAKQLAAAKALGAACVFISSRPNARRKGLRLNRIRWLDQHWVLQPPWATAAASVWERLKKSWWNGLRTLHFATVFEPSERQRRRALRQSLGIASRPYIAFCPGGGGAFQRGPRAADIMLAAAGGIAATADCACVVVLGPNYGKSPAVATGVVTIDRMTNAHLMDLLHDAALVVTGGGDTLLQALALCKPSVAVPVANDQPARIRHCADRGLVQPAELEAGAISHAASALLADRPRRLAMIRALRRCGVRNELPDAVAAIAGLLEAHEASRPPPRSAATVTQGRSVLPIR